MRRYKVGFGVGVGFTVLMVLLAGIWPNGDTGDRGTAEVEPSTSTSMAGAPAAEPTLGEGTASPSPEPSPTERATEPEPEVTAEPDEPARDVHGGPMGTRDRTGTDGIALTFDDGPDPNWTPRVLSALRERGVKATFCVIGAYAEANPDLIADIVHDGHTMCSHTWFHELDLGQWSDEEIRANLQRTNDAIEKAAPGTAVEYFRHPGGQWTDRAVRVAADMGMESLHWDVDPWDWDQSSGKAHIRDHVIDNTEPGSIVLLHDGASNQQNMYGALGPILDEFERREYALIAL